MSFKALMFGLLVPELLQGSIGIESEVETTKEGNDSSKKSTLGFIDMIVSSEKEKTVVLLELKYGGLPYVILDSGITESKGSPKRGFITDKNKRLSESQRTFENMEKKDELTVKWYDPERKRRDLAKELGINFSTFVSDPRLVGMNVKMVMQLAKHQLNSYKTPQKYSDWTVRRYAVVGLVNTVFMETTC